MFIDILFGIVVLLSTYVGYSRGAIIDFLATVVFLLAILGGLIWGQALGGLFFSETNGVPSPWALPLGFILIFVVVYLIGTAIRGAIDRKISASQMVPADKMIGALLGAARGLLVILLVFGVTYTMGHANAVSSTWFHLILEPYIGTFVDFIEYLDWN